MRITSKETRFAPEENHHIKKSLKIVWFVKSMKIAKEFAGADKIQKTVVCTVYG